MGKKPAILTDIEYCHATSKRSGKVRLIEGPHKFSTTFFVFNKINGGTQGIEKKIVVPENSYAIIENVYDKKKKTNNFGSNAIRIGPATFPLYPNEILNRLSENLVIYDNQYVIIKNPYDAQEKKNDFGNYKIIEGPYSGIIYPHEECSAMLRKIILNEDQFVIILNPYDTEKRINNYGDREVIIGPKSVCLYPDEIVDKTPQKGLETFKGSKVGGTKYNKSGDEFDDDDEEENETFEQNWSGVRSVYVLKEGKGLLMSALSDFEDENSVTRHSGDLWVVKGPRRFIPHKYAVVKRKIKAYSLGEYEGIYIKNIKTGKVRLEQGPKNIMLNGEEELFKKEYTESEKRAIGFSTNYNFTMAKPMWVLEREIVCVMTESSRRYVIGPDVIMLDPFERPYILKISGGTPKSSANAIKIWSVKLGPTFSTDLLNVRTQDNATVNLRVMYNWKFSIVDEIDAVKAALKDPKHANHDATKKKVEKIFQISDFIGLAMETMASKIREETAKHNFEELHKNAVDIIKRIILPKGNPHVFKENGFTISDIDVKQIVPTDQEVATKLQNAIKSNMDILVQKMKTEAQLTADLEKIEKEKEIEEKKKDLIAKKQENVKLEADFRLTAQRDEIINKANAEAEAIKIKSQAEISAKEEEMRAITKIVGSTDGAKFLAYEKIKAIANTKKIAIIPEDSKLFFDQKEMYMD